MLDSQTRLLARLYLREENMKITIGALAIFAFLAFLLLTQNDMSPPDQYPIPSIVRTSLPPLANVDELLKKMEFGAVTFNSPKDMNINDSHQIQLLLSVAETTEKLKKAITEEGERIGANIRVSNRMEARLSGYSFNITATTPEIQAVSKDSRTEWRWEIHPKKQGDHRLHLTLTALLEIDGKSTPRAIRTFSKTIEVNVTATQKIEIFVKNNWQWLWAVILVPFVGWLWKRKKKKTTITFK